MLSWQLKNKQTKNGMCRDRKGGSHLRAVVKPPEKGQDSGVTRPNHHGEISFLPLDGYNWSREIHALHSTWGNKHMFTQENAHILALLLITGEGHLRPWGVLWFGLR